MSTQVAPPTPPMQDAFAFAGPRSQSSSKPVTLILGIAMVLVVVAAGGLLFSVSQGKHAAEVARDSARASLSTAQAQVSSLQSQSASAEARAQSLQSQVDASAWKVQAYVKENACINAIIAAYNAVDYEFQLGPAMNNTFANGACEKVFAYSAKNPS